MAEAAGLDPAVGGVVDELEGHELVAGELQHRQGCRARSQAPSEHLVAEGGVERERTLQVGDPQADVQGPHRRPSLDCSVTGNSEVGDAVALDADRRVAQEDIVRRQLTEVGTALAHDHGHQVDGDRVEQAQLEALAGDGAGRHRYGALLGDGLRLGDVAVQRPRRGRYDLSHVLLLRPSRLFCIDPRTNERYQRREGAWPKRRAICWCTTSPASGRHCCNSSSRLWPVIRYSVRACVARTLAAALRHARSDTLAPLRQLIATDDVLLAVDLVQRVARLRP